MPIQSSFSLSRKLEIGDLLTAATILISLISVLVSWRIDRKIRLAREADDIRSAAASTLGDLERWNDLSLSLYAEVQPVFVDASEIIARAEAETSHDERVERARDLLWKGINEAHIAIRRKVVDEKIDNGYTRLFGYYPAIRRIYQDALTRMRMEESSMVNELLEQIELAVMSFAQTDRKLHSAEIADALRSTARKAQARHQERLRGAMRNAEKFLIEKIEADDEYLLSGEE